MAIGNFIVEGSYTKITGVSYNRTHDHITFVVETCKEKDGPVIMSSQFVADRNADVFEYTNSHINDVQLTPPEYPAVCKVREAKVPMWTEDSTQNEKNTYNLARQKFEQAVQKYQADFEKAQKQVVADAQVNNKFDRFFSKRQIFDTSNIVECGYKYLLSMDIFNGCVNV